MDLKSRVEKLEKELEDTAEWLSQQDSIAAVKIAESIHRTLYGDKEEKLKHCSGCRNDFYNGNNNLGVEECWSLKKARLVLKKEVHINQIPPWNQEPKQVLSCYHRDGYVYVDPERTC